MRMPVLFFGHGSPVIALQNNVTTQHWRHMALRVEQDYGRPKAILSVSAHWLTRGVAVTAMPVPPTIHDFGPSLPKALFDVRYPAPGSPDLARKIASLFAPVSVTLDTWEWGLDHGTWSVLCKAWPDADIPIVQLSLDITRSPQKHYALAQKLKPLRDEGILIIGTGNIVHNLPRMDWGNQNCQPYPWAQSFDDYIVQAIAKGNIQDIIDYETQGESASLSVPSPDHFWPLFYTLGAAQPEDRIVFEPRHIEHSSLSMTSVAWWP